MERDMTTAAAVGAVFVDGIPVAPSASVPEFVATIVDDTGRVAPGFAVAVNAEKIIRARSDRRLRAILTGDSLCYPDGIAVVHTMRRKGAATARIPGVEVWEALMRRAAACGVSVFLIGASADVNRRTRERLAQETGVKVVGAVDGFFRDEAALVEQVVRSGARIITVAMGSPAQEDLIERLRQHVPEAFFMGVGGTYDVFVGNVQRAPRVFRELGLEWLYRLLRQPTRWRRQLVLAVYARDHLLGRL